MINKKFNMIGFDFQRSSTWRPKKKCAIHEGNVLIPRVDENGEYIPGLQCPICGTRYEENEAPTDEGIKGKFSGETKTRIISANSKKKRYHDGFGNEINTEDKDVMSDIAQGNSVIYYHEEKSGKEEN